MSLFRFGKIVSTLLLTAALGLPQQAKSPAAPGMTLTTAAFADGSEIPGKYTQSVPSPVSPSLEWSNVPANVASFVLLMHDPDVAVQKKTDDVLHWLMVNIPGSMRSLPEGVPVGAQGPEGSVQLKNAGGVNGYRGPGAPAAGPYHHYTLELFALDSRLDLGPEATRADVLRSIDGHILAKAVLVGRFHR